MLPMSQTMFEELVASTARKQVELALREEPSAIEPDRYVLTQAILERLG